MQFDANWPARQGRLPCLGREGWQRHFAFDLHIEMSKIRPFGLEFCLRPAGTLSFFVSFVLFRFNSFLPIDAIMPPAQNQPPVGWHPFRFSFLPFYFILIRFISFIFVYFRFISFILVYFRFFAFRNRSKGVGVGGLGLPYNLRLRRILLGFP